jgi:hypothetical protein
MHGRKRFGLLFASSLILTMNLAKAMRSSLEAHIARRECTDRFVVWPSIRANI